MVHLVEILHGLRHGVVDYESDVRLVDAHPEGDGGDDSLNVAGDPPPVNFRPEKMLIIQPIGFFKSYHPTYTQAGFDLSTNSSSLLSGRGRLYH
jgi:hypothetical protein